MMSKSGIELNGSRPASSEPPVIRTIAMPKDTTRQEIFSAAGLWGKWTLLQAALPPAVLKGVALPLPSRQ